MVATRATRARRGGEASGGGDDEDRLGQIDPATRFLYTPHTVAFLVLGLGALVHFSGVLAPELSPRDPAAAAALSYANAKTGVWALILVYLGYSVVQGPPTPLVRPHPAVWRLVHGIMVVYLCLMVFLLFQTVDDARLFLRHLYPELGVELPEKAYGEDCALWLGGGRGWNWPVISGAIDEFVLAHALGWWGKALILRDNLMLWTLSILFELMEMTFQHWLPNFNECWWDHWLLDVALCNWAGLALGMWTVRYFRSKQYDWGGLSTQPTLMAKARRSVLQFTPRSFESFEWRVFSSPKRCLQMLSAVGLFLLVELNHFFLKAALWVPPINPLNTYRLTIMFLMGLPAIKEFYEFLESDSSNPFTKLGTFAWLGIAMTTVETLVTIKFGHGLYTQPWPTSVLVAWGVAGSAFVVIMAVWSWRHYRGGRGASARGGRGKAKAQ